MDEEAMLSKLPILPSSSQYLNETLKKAIYFFIIRCGDILSVSHQNKISLAIHITSFCSIPISSFLEIFYLTKVPVIG